MCYNIKTILNRRIDFRHTQDQLYVNVPCGHCLDCLRDKRDDYFVRLYYEWKKFKKGVVYFPTLTYNPQHVPLVDTSLPEFQNLPFGDLPQVQTMSFDKIGVRNFIKKLRKQMYRVGLLANECDLKYFVTSEYGETTCRPHYHCLFFLPNGTVDSNTFRKFVERAWSTRISNSDVLNDVPDAFRTMAELYFKSHPFSAASPETNIFAPYGKGEICLYLATQNSYGKIHYFKKMGNVSYSNDFGAAVNDVKALSYVTTYVSKYSDNHLDLNHQLLNDYIYNLPSNSDIKVSKSMLTALKTLKSILPFTICSNGLGIDLFDDLQLRSELVTKHDELMRNELLPNRISIKGFDRYFKIPKYITSKLFYMSKDVHRLDVCTSPDGREVVDIKTTKKTIYTALGAEVVKMRAKLKVKSMVQLYNAYLSPNFANFAREFVTNDSLASKFFQINHPPVCSSLELLAIYKLKYQNLCTYGYDICGSDDPQIYIDYFNDLVDCQINTYGDVSEFVESPLQELSFRDALFTRPLFNDLPIFDGFDDILAYIDICKSFIAEVRAVSKENRKLVGDKLKQYILSLNY